MSTGVVPGAGDESLYQGEVGIPGGMSMSIGTGGASFWSMLKRVVLFAGFERKASIPEFKHNCFVDS